MLKKAAPFRLPNSTERVCVFGRTGSGKTEFMKWLLSHATIDELPWIILDHKNDGNLKNLPRIEEIKLGELPKYPGLYRVNVRFTERAEMDHYLYKILERGKTGIFTDEGSNLPQREPKETGLKAVFAQGRSKRVPILFATQRPSWINRSVMSESDFYAAFHLSTKTDRDKILEFMPESTEKRLDDYHCHWYDLKKDASFVIRPIDIDETLNRLDERLKPRQHLI